VTATVLRENIQRRKGEEWSCKDNRNQDLTLSNCGIMSQFSFKKKYCDINIRRDAGVASQIRGPKERKGEKRYTKKGNRNWKGSLTSIVVG